MQQHESAAKQPNCWDSHAWRHGPSIQRVDMPQAPYFFV